MAPRILIADDDSGARNQLAGWLEQAGYACARVGTDGALAEARRAAPDVAVVGVTVPDDGGMWVVRSLRSQPEPVGVVVRSSEPSLDVATTATRHGAVDCLPWPTSERSLVDAVRRAAEWRGNLAAVYGRRSRLQDEVAHNVDDLRATLARTDPAVALSVLLAMLESRSPDIYDHVNRVARSAAALARAMRLAAAEVRSVRSAALLHDVGKVVMPARILSQPGALTENEITCLRQHVGVGAEVLESIPTLAALAAVVAATHERFDGSGFPEGLAGADIPLGARIIAVADVYDMLTAQRSFHDPVSSDEANAELVRSAGTQFDPDVVRCWLQMVDTLRCS